MDTLYFLQHYWWALVALLGAILVFLLFVQGAQGLLLRTASSEDEKDLVVKYAGHKWEITRGGFRLLSTVLFHQLRRGLLAVDLHPASFRDSGILLRIPQGSGQYLRGTYI